PPSTSPLLTLSLHDALPIWPSFSVDRRWKSRHRSRSRSSSTANSRGRPRHGSRSFLARCDCECRRTGELVHEVLAELEPLEPLLDRKSIRLNSSHQIISYAV